MTATQSPAVVPADPATAGTTSGQVELPGGGEAVTGADTLGEDVNAAVTALPVARLSLSLDDVDRALQLLLAVGGDDDQVRYVVVEGNPPSKSRPRFSKHGATYTPQGDRIAERRTADALRDVFPEPMRGNVAIACVFYRATRSRIDADNMLKHVCDAATKVVWLDDSQATAVAGVVELDRERPRTLIAIAHHRTTMTRGSDATRICERCGVTYEWKASHAPGRRFCTARCAGKSPTGADLDELVPCPICGQSFRRGKAAQRFCSKSCARTTRPAPVPPRGCDAVTFWCPSCADVAAGDATVLSCDHVDVESVAKVYVDDRLGLHVPGVEVMCRAVT